MPIIKGKPILPGETRWLERGIFARCTRRGKVRYGISFMDGTRRLQQMVPGTLSDARKALEARRTDLERGDYRHIERSRRSLTFEEFAKGYLEQVAAEKRSVRRDDLTVRAALPVFGHKCLDQIEPTDIRTFVQRRLDGGCRAKLRIHRGRPLSKATVNRDLAVIKHIMQRAVDDGLLPANPARKVKLFRVQEQARRVLSEDEETRLLEAAAPHLRPLLVVALNTGLRRGELMGLRWTDVDMTSNYVLVQRRTKSYCNRTVPLNRAAKRALANLPLPHDGLVFRFRGSGLEDVKKALAGAVRRAGITHMTLHACRHTFATRLVLAGVPLPCVQRLLGHADIKTTMRYAHPAPEDLRDAVSKVDGSWAVPKDRPPSSTLESTS